MTKRERNKLETSVFKILNKLDLRWDRSTNDNIWSNIKIYRNTRLNTYIELPHTFINENEMMLIVSSSKLYNKKIIIENFDYSHLLSGILISDIPTSKLIELKLKYA